MNSKTADVDDMNCPKCGFQQEKGTECVHCGIVFSRYHAMPKQVHSHSEPRHFKIGISPLRLFFRIFRWSTYAILIAAIILALCPAKPPKIIVPPDAGQQAEDKVQQFQSSIQHGATDKLELNQSELNSWLSSNLALKKASPSITVPQLPNSPDSIARIATRGQPLDDVTIQQAQSSVRDVKIELHESTLLVYVVFDMHGMDLSLELEGRLSVEDGYLRLDPTAGKLGSLPLMAGTLQAAAARLFNSSENKEKFKLPPEIQDISIEHGNLVVTSR
jgi:hypothetical protein